MSEDEEGRYRNYLAWKKKYLLKKEKTEKGGERDEEGATEEQEGARAQGGGAEQKPLTCGVGICGGGEERGPGGTTGAHAGTHADAGAREATEG